MSMLRWLNDNEIDIRIKISANRKVGGEEVQGWTQCEVSGLFPNLIYVSQELSDLCRSKINRSIAMQRLPD